MPINVACVCGQQYAVKDEYAGMRMACPNCGSYLTIPPPRGPESVTTSPMPHTRRDEYEEEEPSGRNLLPVVVAVGLLLVLVGVGVGAVLLLNPGEGKPT